MARLIDADALIDKLRRSVEETRFEWMEQALRYRDKVIFAIDCISEAPTIDAAPVRRGEWRAAQIVGYDGVHAVYAKPCSVCGEFSKEARSYCPNCGADMRKEERNA